MAPPRRIPRPISSYSSSSSSSSSSLSSSSPPSSSSPSSSSLSSSSSSSSPSFSSSSSSSHTHRTPTPTHQYHYDLDPPIPTPTDYTPINPTNQTLQIRPPSTDAGDRLRLHDVPPALMLRLHRSVLSRWRRGIQAITGGLDMPSGLVYKFRGYPFGTDGVDALRGMRFVGRILAFLAGEGWFPVLKGAGGFSVAAAAGGGGGGGGTILVFRYQGGEEEQERGEGGGAGEEQQQSVPGMITPKFHDWMSLSLTSNNTLTLVDAPHRLLTELYHAFPPQRSRTRHGVMPSLEREPRAHRGVRGAVEFRFGGLGMEDALAWVAARLVAVLEGKGFFVYAVVRQKRGRALGRGGGKEVWHCCREVGAGVGGESEKEEEPSGRVDDDGPRTADHGSPGGDVDAAVGHDIDEDDDVVVLGGEEDDEGHGDRGGEGGDSDDDGDAAELLRNLRDDPGGYTKVYPGQGHDEPEGDLESGRGGAEGRDRGVHHSGDVSDVELDRSARSSPVVFGGGRVEEHDAEDVVLKAGESVENHSVDGDNENDDADNGDGEAPGRSAGSSHEVHDGGHDEERHDGGDIFVEAGEAGGTHGDKDAHDEIHDTDDGHSGAPVRSARSSHGVYEGGHDGRHVALDAGEGGGAYSGEDALDENGGLDDGNGEALDQTAISSHAIRDGYDDGDEGNDEEDVLLEVGEGFGRDGGDDDDDDDGDDESNVGNDGPAIDVGGVNGLDHDDKSESDDSDSEGGVSDTGDAGVSEDSDRDVRREGDDEEDDDDDGNVGNDSPQTHEGVVDGVQHDDESRSDDSASEQEGGPDVGDAGVFPAMDGGAGRESEVEEGDSEEEDIQNDGTRVVTGHVGASGHVDESGTDHSDLEREDGPSDGDAGAFEEDLDGGARRGEDEGKAGGANAGADPASNDVAKQ